jgi:nitroreductase
MATTALNAKTELLETTGGRQTTNSLVHQLSYLYTSTKVLGFSSANDAGLMMENLILSAHAYGLGTCPQGAAAIWDDVVRKEFDVPKNYRLALRFSYWLSK